MIQSVTRGHPTPGVDVKDDPTAQCREFSVGVFFQKSVVISCGIVSDRDEIVKDRGQIVTRS